MSKPWTEIDLKDLKAVYPHFSNAEVAEELGRSVPAISNAAVKLGLHKSADYMAAQPGCFKSGATPWNKGKPHKAGGRSAETRFQARHMPQNWVPVGHERISREGILERKVTDTRCSKDDFRSVHSLIWEEHNGPIPAGHIVRFKDGDKRNFDPENLELVSRAENMRLNSVHRMPKEVALAVQMLGALNRQINKRAQA